LPADALDSLFGETADGVTGFTCVTGVALQTVDAALAAAAAAAEPHVVELSCAQLFCELEFDLLAPAERAAAAGPAQPLQVGSAAEAHAALAAARAASTALRQPSEFCHVVVTVRVTAAPAGGAAAASGAPLTARAQHAGGVGCVTLLHIAEGLAHGGAGEGGAGAGPTARFGSDEPPSSAAGSMTASAGWAAALEAADGGRAELWRRIGALGRTGPAGAGGARLRGRSASLVGGVPGAPACPPLVVRALADVLDARAPLGTARARVVALCHVRRGFAGCELGALAELQHAQLISRARLRAPRPAADSEEVSAALALQATLEMRRAELGGTAALARSRAHLSAAAAAAAERAAALHAEIAQLREERARLRRRLAGEGTPTPGLPPQRAPAAASGRPKGKRAVATALAPDAASPAGRADGHAADGGADDDDGGLGALREAVRQRQARLRALRAHGGGSGGGGGGSGGGSGGRADVPSLGLAMVGLQAEMEEAWRAVRGAREEKEVLQRSVEESIAKQVRARAASPVCRARALSLFLSVSLARSPSLSRFHARSLTFTLAPCLSASPSRSRSVRARSQEFLFESRQVAEAALQAVGDNLHLLGWERRNSGAPALALPLYAAALALYEVRAV
jgi:hypothetical protein